MSLTDVPKQLKLAEVYPSGIPFLISQAWFEGIVDTTFGKRAMAKVIASPYQGPGVTGAESQEFALWGTLCEQVQQLEEGDVPGVYTLGQEGKRVVFQAYEQSAEDVLPDASPSSTQEAAPAA